MHHSIIIPRDDNSKADALVKAGASRNSHCEGYDIVNVAQMLLICISAHLFSIALMDYGL